MIEDREIEFLAIDAQLIKFYLRVYKVGWAGFVLFFLAAIYFDRLWLLMCSHSMCVVAFVTFWFLHDYLIPFDNSNKLGWTGFLNMFLTILFSAVLYKGGIHEVLIGISILIPTVCILYTIRKKEQAIHKKYPEWVYPKCPAEYV
jgi:hypothetical protein